MHIADAGLPHSLQAMVEGELDRDERVLWAGQPMAGRMIRAALPASFFGLLWGSFAVFWFGQVFWPARQAVVGAPFELVLPFIALPFVIVSLRKIASPLRIGVAARRTAYVVTDRRVIVFRGGPRGTQVRSFTPEALRELERRQFPDGSGDLVFGRDMRTSARGRYRSAEGGFLAIPDVKSVEELVRAMVASQIA